MKSISSLIALTLAGMALVRPACLELRGAIVSFAFSGTVTTFINPSNALPPDITFGTPFTGVFTYDTSAVMGGDTSQDPEIGDYYFRDIGGFWLQINMAGHTVATLTTTPADQTASIAIHAYAGIDSTFSASASEPTIRLDGAGLPGTYVSSGLGLDFYDNSGTGTTNDALPTAPLTLNSFPSTHRFELNSIDAQHAWVFDIIGTITNIVPVYEPPLAIHRNATNAVVAWPLAGAGFTLESCTNLTSASWQAVPAAVVDVGTEHTVTLPLNKPDCFYRLKK